MNLYVYFALTINYALAHEIVAPTHRLRNYSILDDKLFLFQDGFSTSNFSLPMIIGEIDLQKSVSLDQYSFRWWEVGGTSIGSVIIGTSRRAVLSAANTTTANPVFNFTLATFDPETSIYDSNLPWSPEIPPDDLPSTVPQIVILEQNVSYHTGERGINTTRLVKYDITKNKWNILESPPRRWESGTFVPVGRKGVIIMLGGNTYSDPLDSALSLGQVYIFDLATETWHRRTTSGTAPPGRQAFCTTAVSTVDGSSHQVRHSSILEL
ncbi:hypothetical protein K440DRAFT_635928 [Wilcoxina mikolae CBS 423.85]|nr:hypothetical protein K440DRAFT_635928 [Wilcoxina mikolae CBS 423.85]